MEQVGRGFVLQRHDEYARLLLDCSLFCKWEPGTCVGGQSHFHVEESLFRTKMRDPKERVTDILSLM